ncbi:hypothetical protein FGO68_gene681 [Halteria grandinella]|uniref:Uncharacterized protein n=1 Tax=Halteria grandinella TaxID=5974 RepID=A0A8J8NF32_HALGN|nr:hypothetical protein FGO68_gene681 [Halteria grandinella]
MLLSGTGNTIIMKVQNLTYGETLPTDPKQPMPFTHPFVQCAVMFLGELLCLFVYFGKLGFTKSKLETNPISDIQAGLKTHINPLLLAIPASFDIIASTLMNIALTMVAPSVYQMLRSMKIIFTAAMSIVFLKKKLYRHHWTSIGCIFFGLVLVGISVFKNSSAKSIETKPLGVVILVVASVFSSGLYVVEEKLLGSYQLDPLKVVGLEGMWGCLMWAVLLPLFQQIPCHIDALCPYGTLEDSVRAVHDFEANHNLIYLSVGVLFTMALFNGFGVTVTKHASSAQRATIDTARTLLIWVFFMIVEVNGKKEEFHVLQLIGFIFLSIGTLVFNEIVVIPVLGFDQYTKAALAKRSQHMQGDDRSGLLDHPPSHYSGVSPLTASSQMRNNKNIEKIQEASGSTKPDPTMNSSTIGEN